MCGKVGVFGMKFAPETLYKFSKLVSNVGHQCILRVCHCEPYYSADVALNRFMAPSGHSRSNSPTPCSAATQL